MITLKYQPTHLGTSIWLGHLKHQTKRNEVFQEGNCRFAIQLYFYRIHNHWLEKDEVYLPGGYEHLGEFVFREESIDFSVLKPSNIIYAQNLKQKDGTYYARDPKTTRRSPTGDLISTQLYTSAKLLIRITFTAPVVFAAVWPLEQFVEYYKPISVKRLPI